MYLDNNWYGHRHIISKYCRTKNIPTFATIQHGWISHQEAKKFPIGNRKIKSAPYLSWNNNVKKYAEQHGVQNVIPIGSPFLYLHFYFKRKKIKKKRSKGTILFPSHSIKKMSNHGAFIQKIDKENLTKFINKKFPGPYTVCLFYTDYTSQNIKFYKNKGWRVVCCGERSNNYFLYNLYEYLISHKNIVCTDFTSALLYGMFLKKNCTLIKELIINKKIIKVQKRDYKKRIGKDVEEGIIQELKSRFPKLFNSSINNRSSYNFAKKELGFKFLKKEKKLKEIMGWESKIKIMMAKFISFLILMKYDSDIKN